MAATGMHDSSGTLDFDSKEYDYPLPGFGLGDGDDDDNNMNTSAKRSIIKKPGQSRSAQNSSMLLKVSFRDVHLREYGMVLGDNPAVSHGAPVQLDWEPQECHDPVHIDNYEKARSLWRAKDRRGFLLNAHKRVKILFAAGYTIDEIAKATMEMKELRQLRADSLKTQGMMTGAIMALLSGAAETTGQTVRAVTILPNALAGAGKAMVNGTNKAIVGAGSEMMGLTNKVVNSTTNAAKRTSSVVTGAATQATKGTGKVVVGTGKLMVKGTTGLVTGTTKVVTGTGKISMDLAKGTGKAGMDFAKGTGNVMVGGTKSLVKGTGVLFSGTAGVMKASTKRLSRMVSSGMDSSSHSGMDDDSSNRDMDESERSRGSIFGGVSMPGLPKKNKFSRSSLPAHSESDMGGAAGRVGGGGGGIPKPTNLTRQRSLDSAQAAAAEKGSKAKLTEELLEMQDFLVQLEGMDKNMVQEIVAEEQAARRKEKNRVKSITPKSSSFDAMNLSPDPQRKKNRGTSLIPSAANDTIAQEQMQRSKNRGTSLIPLSLGRKISGGSVASTSSSTPKPTDPINLGGGGSMHAPKP